MKANAVVFTAPNTVTFTDVTCPEPGPEDVVVRVTQSWISNGTEGSYLRGERIAGDTPWRPGDPTPFPIVPGYQKVGVVEWVSPEITDLAVGDRVFSVMGKVDGMFEPGGGHISPSISARGGIYKLPEDVDPVAFSGLVLTQVGYNCGARPSIDVGQAALVIGDGLVGQWAAQTLAWRGADVVLAGRHDGRLTMFPEGHLRRTINTRKVDIVDYIKGRFPGGLRVMVDTVGSVPVIESLLRCMVKYGDIVSAGFYGTDDRLALQPPRYGELSIHLVSGLDPDRMVRTLDLIAAGHLQTLPLITHRFPVDHIADAWRLIESKSEPVLGVVLDW